jgi:hypothetical protein
MPLLCGLRGERNGQWFVKGRDDELEAMQPPMILFHDRFLTNHETLSCSIPLDRLLEQEQGQLS